jgi:ribA/ribD-fused uncharacterized protein
LFTVNGVVYSSAEQFLMAGKARIFDDPETLAMILSTDIQPEIKQLGRAVKHFSESQWEDVRYSVAFAGNFAKFTQDKNYFSYLIGTGDSLIVEASPYDRIWGVGLSSGDKRVLSPRTRRGRNLLGCVLMDVRDEINRITRNSAKINWELTKEIVADSNTIFPHVRNLSDS